MKNYTCEICGKSHSVYYGSESPLPTRIVELLEVGDEDVLFKLNEEVYIVNRKDVYIKGNLEIELGFEEGGYCHRLWGVFAISDYISMGKLLASGKNVNLNGKIVSYNPLLEECEGLDTVLLINPNDYIHKFRISQESQLKIDQSEPISKKRFIETMQKINHPELWQENRIYSESFSKRLANVLSEAITEFDSVGRLFVIDISNQRETLIQLVSAKMLGEPMENGIGLDIPNDSSNEDYEEIKFSMNGIVQRLRINVLEIAGIETYQKYYGTNFIQIDNELKELIEFVFKENIEELELSIFEH